MTQRDQNQISPWTPPPTAVEGGAGSGQGQLEGEPEGFDLRRVPGLAYRYKWILLSALGLGLLGASVAFSLTPPRYTVNSLIQVGSSETRDTGVTAIQSGQTQSQEDWQNLIRSFSVLEPVVIELGLFISPADPAHEGLFADARVTGGIVPGRYVLEVSPSSDEVRILNADGVEIESRASGTEIGASIGIGLHPAAELLGDAARVEFGLVTPRDAARSLSRSLTVEVSRFTAYMAVSISGSDPVFAARIINAVSESFLREATALSRARSEELGATLAQQLETARASLDAAEEELEAFETSNILAPSQLATTGGSSPSMDAYIDLQLQIDELSRDRAAIMRALESGDGEGVRIQALEANPAIRSSSELIGVLEEIATARAERRSLLLRYTPDHPLVTAVSDRLRVLEGSTVPMLARQVVQELDARIGALDASRRTRASELSSIPTRSITQAGLRREVSRAEMVYEDVSSRYAEAQLAAISASPGIRVVDWAVPPTRPDADRKLLTALMAFLGFTGAGVLGAFFLARGDRRVRSPSQVEWQLGLQVLGVLPHLNGTQGRGGELGRDQAVEAFRAIRTGILYAHGSAGPLVLTVSSPGVGDGKSFTTSNLGLCFAELGRRTVIVDGDVRRGIQHKLMDVERKPGLTDLLSGNAGIEGVLRPTAHPMLSVIPMGSLTGNAPELLCTEEMQTLMAQLKERFDVILVDSSPLGAAADTVILGTLTGNLVLVVRSGQTDAEHAEAMLRNLRRFPVRILGSIVNDVSRSDDYSYYGYIPGYTIEQAEAEGSAKPALRLTGTRGE
jgi:polysaccharide biosynthesis transport protein